MNDKGITLISLVTIIIVIVILASVSVYTGIDVLNKSKLTKFNAELKIIQSRVNQIVEEGISEEYMSTIGRNISSLDETTKNKITTALQGKLDTGFKFFDASLLEQIGIDRVKREVIINFTTKEVIDINGIEKDGEIIYRATDSQYNVQYKEQDSRTINFDLSKKTYGLEAKIFIQEPESNINTSISYTLLNETIELRMEECIRKRDNCNQKWYI